MIERTYTVKTELSGGAPIHDAVLTEDGINAIAPLLVQFGSYRKSNLIEPVTCEMMADRYKKEGI